MAEASTDPSPSHELAQLLAELFGPPAGRAATGPWLLVGAHPDDETIGASWLLSRGPRLSVVQITDGAPHDQKFWPASALGSCASTPSTREGYAALRRQETEAALALVGLGADRILNLGFADQTAAFALVACVRALRALFAATAPAVIVTHAYEGGHPDHDAAAFAVRAAASLRAREGGAQPWIVEMSSYHRAEGALCTGTFLPHRGPVAVRALSAAERALKRRMFARYASQRDVLDWFRIDEERYRPAQPLCAGAAPHLGTLQYEALGLALDGGRFRALVAAALETLELEDRELGGGAG